MDDMKNRPQPIKDEKEPSVLVCVLSGIGFVIVFYTLVGITQFIESYLESNNVGQQQHNQQ